VSVRQNVRDGAGIAGWTIFVALLVVIVIVIAALTWSGLAPWVADKKREINENSQQFQDALVREQRNLVTAINTAVNKEQKQFFTEQFCAEYVNIESPPNDLTIAHGKLC
jgi:predicted negative regulator of RcsB-dependent stress response